MLHIICLSTSLVAHSEKLPFQIVGAVERVPSKVRGAVTYGPWGGKGGFVFDDGVSTGVRQINLSRNIGIVSIKVLYDQNEQAVWGSKNGGTGGFRNDKVNQNFTVTLVINLEPQKFHICAV